MANKWHLIANLFAPNRVSVNDSISQGLTLLQYASIDDATATILKLGKERLMAKLDLKATYSSVPVHLNDRPLLVGKRPHTETQLYLLVSPLRQKYSQQWQMLSKGIGWAWHYLDNFIIFGRPGLQVSALDKSLQTCSELGWEAHKAGGPSTCLVFLGIEIDLVHSRLCLPTNKLMGFEN